ncbi:hypothetical protein OCS_03122 [Ophiocordyceps sinensis CO18]|uniref:Uncharacterized protein n=1 Tax=Ophiocordyceps sinensis (strain Co18 / CGMCC 3.14243) TaxID=911162 RepID=T5AH72_OPHSC|nr:hypothetical protein OCS_03122 [Ophiocordyceps sinensis CO18]
MLIKRAAKSEDGLREKFGGAKLICLQNADKVECSPKFDQEKGGQCSDCFLLSDRNFVCENGIKQNNAPPKAPEPSAGKGANPPSFSAEEKEAARNEACVDFKGTVEACLAAGRKCVQDFETGGKSWDPPALQDCLRSASATAEKIETMRNELCADFKGDIKACELAGWKCTQDFQEKGVRPDIPAFKDCLRNSAKGST